MSELTIQGEKKCECTAKIKRFVEELATSYGFMAVKFDIKWQGDYSKKYVLCTNHMKWVLIRQDDIESMQDQFVKVANKDKYEYYMETIKPFKDSMPEGDSILGKYMHFKGNTYTVRYAAIYCPEMDTYMNVYIADRDGVWYCREVESFYAPDEMIISRVENVTGQKERFKKIEEEKEISK